MASVAFSVDSSTLTPESLLHVLTGTRDSSIVEMRINNQAGRIYFPTSTTWRADLILEPGENIFLIRGKDTADNWTAAMEVALEAPAYAPEEYAYYGTLDNHGIVVGLERNPGEKNWDFRTRLISFSRADSGAHLEGMFQSMAHELGIRPVERALVIDPGRTVLREVAGTAVNVEVEATRILVDANEMIITENLIVDPRFRRLYLSYEPRAEDEVSITTETGDPVSPRNFDVDLFNKHVTFNSDDMNGQCLVVQYNYRSEISYLTMTMDHLKTALEAILVGDRPILSVTVEDGSLPALGLQLKGRGLVSRSASYVVPNARIRIVGLDDMKYQASLLNQFGAAYGTKLERYARITREKSNIGWDNLIMDEGFWDTDIEDRALDFLPRLFDAVMGRWFCTLPTHDAAYNLVDYKRYGGMCPEHPEYPLEYKGVTDDQMRSGPCEAESLFTTVAEAPEEL